MLTDAPGPFNCQVQLSHFAGPLREDLGIAIEDTQFQLNLVSGSPLSFLADLVCQDVVVTSVSSGDPDRSITLISGSTVPESFPDLRTALSNLGYVNDQFVVSLPPDTILYGIGFNPANTTDIQGLILKVILPTPASLGDVVIDQTVGPSRFGISRLGVNHHGASSRFALAYTEIDSLSDPSDSQELIKFCLFESPDSLSWNSCHPKILHTRSRIDPSSHDIGALEIALGEDGFHAVGWVEVSGSPSTTVKSFVSFSTDGGNNWTTEEVASFRYPASERQFIGDIDLAVTDAGTIGVLLPFDRGTSADGWKLRGQDTNHALVLLEYARESLSFPREIPIVTVAATIDYPSTAGTRNVVDMTTGYSGNYQVNAGWIEASPPHPVLHVYYAQGGATKVFTWGMTSNGSIANPPPSYNTLRTVPAPNTGFPWATNTYRNAHLKINGYSIENPPKTAGNSNLYPISNVPFGAPSGNRTGDTVFTTEASTLPEDPQKVDVHFMNSAGIVYGPYQVDSPVIFGSTTLPHCDDIGDGPCYFYQAQQYAQEDRGALVQTNYETTSVRVLTIKEHNATGETISQVILHRGDSYRGDFASTMALDRLGPINNSTNETGATRMLRVDSVSWGMSATVWSPPATGTIGTVRTTMTSYKSEVERCLAAPNITGLSWTVHFWPDLASFHAHPDTGTLVASFNDPSNFFYPIQYGIFTPPGCSQPQPVTDLRFDLRPFNFHVQQGQDVVIAITADGSMTANGVMFRMASAIPPFNSDLYAGDVTGGIPIPLSSYVPSYPRFGGVITLIPDYP